MKRDDIKILISSILISTIGVFGIDYFSHLLFFNPMETLSYFFAKMTFYFVFSILFLSLFNLKKKEFIKIIDYYPWGISLSGLSFLGMGLVGTGLAFGTVHTLAFIIGYYISKYLLIFFKR